MISIVTADGVVRDQLPDDTLLVFLSDTHIGGAADGDIFESADELRALLEDLRRHHGPVELVLAGDFLDVLRMEDAGSGGDRVAATISRPEYQGCSRRCGPSPGLLGIGWCTWSATMMPRSGGTLGCSGH
jgi:hypothetical protein